MNFNFEAEDLENGNHLQFPNQGILLHIIVYYCILLHIIVYYS